MKLKKRRFFRVEFEVVDCLEEREVSIMEALCLINLFCALDRTGFAGGERSRRIPSYQSINTRKSADTEIFYCVT
jgi:hypothetical protein